MQLNPPPLLGSSYTDHVADSLAQQFIEHLPIQCQEPL